jgi:hypothetical protein
MRVQLLHGQQAAQHAMRLQRLREHAQQQLDVHVARHAVRDDAVQRSAQRLQTILRKAA